MNHLQQNQKKNLASVLCVKCLHGNGCFHLLHCVSQTSRNVTPYVLCVRKGVLGPTSQACSVPTRWVVCVFRPKGGKRSLHAVDSQPCMCLRFVVVVSKRYFHFSGAANFPAFFTLKCRMTRHHLLCAQPVLGCSGSGKKTATFRHGDETGRMTPLNYRRIGDFVARWTTRDRNRLLSATIMDTGFDLRGPSNIIGKVIVVSRRSLDSQGLVL